MRHMTNPPRLDTDIATTGLDIVNALIKRGVKDAWALRVVLRDSQILMAGLGLKPSGTIADELITTYGTSDPSLNPAQTQPTMLSRL
jgi:hypothetical protein